MQNDPNEQDETDQREEIDDVIDDIPAFREFQRERDREHLTSDY